MICSHCQIDKPESEFPVRNDRSGRLRPYCKQCDNAISKARYAVHKRSQPFKLKCTRAKSRATDCDVPFDLTPEYLESIWTGICPITGESMEMYGDRSDERIAELDRFVPDLGYVKGNVHFISRKMNRVKNNVTTNELRKILTWMESVENGQTA